MFTKTMRPVRVAVGCLLAAQLGASLLTNLGPSSSRGSSECLCRELQRGNKIRDVKALVHRLSEHSVNASGGGDNNDYQY